LLDNVRIERPELVHEILRSEITDAFLLVEQSESGTNRRDFQREFHSYWNRQAKLSSNRVYSLLKTLGPSRLIRFWRGKSWSVAGETEEEIAFWLKHRHGTDPDYEHSHRACLLWLPTPLTPDEYPQSGANLYSLAMRTPEGGGLLRKLALMDDAPFPIIFGADTENGPCFAAVDSYRPSRFHARGGSSAKVRPGFRPGKVPPDLQTQYLFSPTARVVPFAVDRVDASWIHGRGHDMRQKTIANKHVVIAGCGSVGAPVAQQLAMAGVGRLSIVDPETLAWANTGRYPLGSKFVGLQKARALSGFLQENLPHLRIDGFVGKIEDFLANSTDPSPDLIVVATADWSCERILNLRHIDGQITCPLLFTWTEPHACAGHAVYLPCTKACLQCGLTLGGDMRRPVTTWPADKASHLSEPACGAYFQPYGPIELMGTVAVAASLALDALLRKLDSATQRVWAGSKLLLEENGGVWSDTWIAGHANRVGGSLQENLIWEQDPNCNACGQGRGTSFSQSASLASKS
jgi:hypothetical protein